MNRENRKRLLSQVHEGSFILCLDLRECRWAIYCAKLPGSDSHCLERGVVFTDEPFDLPDEVSPIRYWGCHYTVQSQRYDFNIDAVDLGSIAAIYATEGEAVEAAERLREQESQYVAATDIYRDRFKVFAKLMAAS